MSAEDFFNDIGCEHREPLGFTLFCFVNTAPRIVPRVAGDDVEPLLQP